MTPKEKAIELRDKMWLKIPSVDPKGMIHYPIAKKMALIAVDEILDLNLGLSNCDENNWKIEKFYEEVKQEIKKL